MRAEKELRLLKAESVNRLMSESFLGSSNFSMANLLTFVNNQRRSAIPETVHV